MKCGVAFSDLFTSLYSVIGVLAALHSRTETGRGQHVDMALLDSQVAVLANQALNYLVSGVAPTRLGNAHPNIVPYQAFPTKDGFMILAIGSNRQFTAFCTTAGLDGVDQDPRFATHRARVENRDLLAAIIADVLETRTTEDWVAPARAACRALRADRHDRRGVHQSAGSRPRTCDRTAAAGRPAHPRCRQPDPPVGDPDRI